MAALTEHPALIKFLAAIGKIKNPEFRFECKIKEKDSKKPWIGLLVREKDET